MFLALGTWKSQASATVVLHLQTLGRQGLSVCLYDHCAAQPGTQPDAQTKLHRTTEGRAVGCTIGSEFRPPGT